MATFAMQHNNKRWSSPRVLFRVSSILMVGLMIGHMSAYPWVSIKATQESLLRTTMKSLPFVFMGERSTYWNLYFGWGILVGVLLLTLAGILWILSDVTTLRQRSTAGISAVISTTSLVGAYLSFRFFYIPPFVLFSIICTILLAATVQLLNRRNE